MSPGGSGSAPESPSSGMVPDKALAAISLGTYCSQWDQPQ